MAQHTSDRFARCTSHRPGDGRNEPTGGNDSGFTCDNQHSDQRPPCLAVGEHTYRAFKGCATRANSTSAAAFSDPGYKKETYVVDSKNPRTRSEVLRPARGKRATGGQQRASFDRVIGATRAKRIAPESGGIRPQPA